MGVGSGGGDHHLRGTTVGSHHLEYLLAPQSLAVIGASDRPASVGAMVMRNVLSGGFRGAQSNLPSVAMRPSRGMPCRFRRGGMR